MYRTCKCFRDALSNMPKDRFQKHLVGKKHVSSNFGCQESIKINNNSRHFLNTKPAFIEYLLEIFKTQVTLTVCLC